MYSELVSEFQGGYDWAKDVKKKKKEAKLLDFDLEQAEKIRAMKSPQEILEEQMKLANEDFVAASSSMLDGGEGYLGSTNFEAAGQPAIPDRAISISKPDLESSVISSRETGRDQLAAIPQPSTTMNNPELKETYWDRLRSANAYADGGPARKAPVQRDWFEEMQARQRGEAPYMGNPEMGRRPSPMTAALFGANGQEPAPARATTIDAPAYPMNPDAPPQVQRRQPSAMFPSRGTEPGSAAIDPRLAEAPPRHSQPPGGLTPSAMPIERPNEVKGKTKKAPAAPAVEPGKPSGPQARNSASRGAASPALPTSDTPDVPMFTPAREFKGPVEKMPNVSTKVWSEYRKQVWEAAKAGGRMADVAAVDKYVTGMQHEGFMNYAQEARALLAAGDEEGAKKAIHMAYQYFPNGTQAQFAVQNGKLVAVVLDEDSGKPVAMQAITPQFLDNVIMNFKDPNNFAQHTIDDRAQDLKEREFTDYKLPVGQAQVEAYRAGAKADINNSMANLGRAGAAGIPTGATVSQQQSASRAIAESNDMFLMELGAEDPNLGRGLLSMQMAMLDANPQLVAQPELAAAAGQAIVAWVTGKSQKPGFITGVRGGKPVLRLDNSNLDIEIPQQVYEQLKQGT